MVPLLFFSSLSGLFLLFLLCFGGCVPAALLLKKEPLFHYIF